MPAHVLDRAPVEEPAVQEVLPVEGSDQVYQGHGGLLGLHPAGLLVLGVGEQVHVGPGLDDLGPHGARVVHQHHDLDPRDDRDEVGGHLAGDLVVLDPCLKGGDRRGLGRLGLERSASWRWKRRADGMTFPPEAPG